MRDTLALRALCTCNIILRFAYALLDDSRFQTAYVTDNIVDDIIIACTQVSRRNLIADVI